MNLFKFKKGGIYKIVCTKNNKLYYGQTSCFIRRCFQHLQSLENKDHPCLELQMDVSRYSLEAFRFDVVQIQDEHSKRLKLETQFIKSTARHLLYNPKQFIIFNANHVLLNALK